MDLLFDMKPVELLQQTGDVAGGGGQNLEPVQKFMDRVKQREGSSSKGAGDAMKMKER